MDSFGSVPCNLTIVHKSVDLESRIRMYPWLSELKYFMWGLLAVVAVVNSFPSGTGALPLPNEASSVRFEEVM